MAGRGHGSLMCRQSITQNVLDGLLSEYKCCNLHILFPLSWRAAVLTDRMKPNAVTLEGLKLATPIGQVYVPALQCD